MILRNFLKPINSLVCISIAFCSFKCWLLWIYSTLGPFTWSQAYPVTRTRLSLLFMFLYEIVTRPVSRKPGNQA